MLYISDDLIFAKGKNTRFGLVFRKYSLGGSLLSEKFVESKDIVDPGTLIPTSQHQYILTKETFVNGIGYFSLCKLNSSFDTLWSHTIPGFQERQVLMTQDSCLIIYGGSYGTDEERRIHYHYISVLRFDRNGHLLWRRDEKKNFYESPGTIVETNKGNYLFSSSIEPFENKGHMAFIFELDSAGNEIYEHKFPFPMGEWSEPSLIQDGKGFTMFSQKWVGKFGEPAKDIILITNLSE